jgi:bacterioferritin-associated ferredoxin
MKKTPDEIKKQWLLHNEKICLCMGISRKHFVKAIKSGASTLEEINKVVGSGEGECSGERCRLKLEQLIKKYGQ